MRTLPRFEIGESSGTISTFSQPCMDRSKAGFRPMYDRETRSQFLTLMNTPSLCTPHLEVGDKARARDRSTVAGILYCTIPA